MKRIVPALPLALALLLLTGCKSMDDPKAASSGHLAKVFAPAQSCTFVTHRNGDERNVCHHAQGKNLRAFPAYPTVPHGRGDRVQHARYSGGWVMVTNPHDIEEALSARAAQVAAS